MNFKCVRVFESVCACVRIKSALKADANCFGGQHHVRACESVFHNIILIESSCFSPLSHPSDKSKPAPCCKVQREHMSDTQL